PGGTDFPRSSASRRVLAKTTVAALRPVTPCFRLGSFQTLAYLTSVLDTSPATGCDPAVSELGRFASSRLTDLRRAATGRGREASLLVVLGWVCLVAERAKGVRKGAKIGFVFVWLLD